MAVLKGGNLKMENCTRCNGSGNYLNFGRCFRCGGTGKVGGSVGKNRSYKAGDVILKKNENKTFEIVRVTSSAYVCACRTKLSRRQVDSYPVDCLEGYKKIN
jgi:hypothetical protein